MKSGMSTVEETTRRRIAHRLLPFLWLLYMIAFLDRVNVAYAALEMTRDLHFSDSVFGFGAGTFFIGYVLLEIPGALIVEKWSARRWIARIMLSWGVVTIFTGFVRNSHQFYMARFLLGAAEAGFFPGVLVYLTHWFGRLDRTKAIGALMSAIPLANIVGSPIAGKILGIHWYGLPGWRWLFILEGIPALVLGIVTIFYLTDRPAQATWLRGEEREWITQELERDKLRKKAGISVWQALRQYNVILLTLVYFLGTAGHYGFTFWLPTMLKRASGFSTWIVTMLVVLPYLAALAATLLNGWHSDRTQERRLHAAIPLFLGGTSLLLAMALSSHLWLQLGCFILFAACINGYQPCFWALPTATLGASAAAASIGMINSIGNLGGFAGPYVVGYLSTRTGSFVPALGVLMCGLLLAGTVVLSLKGITPSGGEPHAEAAPTPSLELT
jgi:ACS family tartrate transporter-like MFS transporter